MKPSIQPLRPLISIFLGFAATAVSLGARPITAAGQPGVLDIRVAGAKCIRVTLKPQGFKPEFPETPILPERNYPAPALSLREIDSPAKAELADLVVEVQPDPLRIIVQGKDGAMIQMLTFQDN